MKVCAVCSEELPTSSFHKDKSNSDGFRSRCKACVKTYDDSIREQRNERARNAYAIDPASKIKKTREYHVSHPEWSRERLRAHHEANAEERYAAYLERGKDPAVQASRRESSRRCESRRRAIKLGNQADFVTTQDVLDLVSSYDGRCYCCGRPFSADLPVTLDHWQPLARGGAHTVANLRPACSPCNTRKNARWPMTNEDLASVRQAVLGADMSAEREEVMPE